MKKAGHRQIQHRVEKHQHETQKMKVKQQMKNTIRALQVQNDVSESHLSNDAMDSIEAHPSEQIESRLTHHEVRDVEHADIDQAEGEQYMQRNVNQCYANDEEDDVQSGTRKAEEQKRSADEAVGEVHDDSPAGQNQQHGEEEKEDEEREDEEKEDGIDNSNTVGGPTDTAIDIFPGSPIEPTQTMKARY